MARGIRAFLAWVFERVSSRKSVIITRLIPIDKHWGLAYNKVAGSASLLCWAGAGARMVDSALSSLTMKVVIGICPLF